MFEIINKSFVVNKGVRVPYRIVGPEESDRSRGYKIWGTCAIKVQDYELPAVDRSYLVPAEVTNHLGEIRRVLATCNPLHQQVSAPFYLISKERKLVEAEEGGFIDSKLGYSLTHHTLFKDSAPESKLYLKSCA